MDLLNGKAAVVTGAASGIGKAIAAAFIDAGASVLLCDRNADALDTAARELGELARRIVLYVYPATGVPGRDPALDPAPGRDERWASEIRFSRVVVQRRGQLA